MNDTTIHLDQSDEEILAFEISDEALEAAAGTGKEKAGLWTAFCTGISCPGSPAN